MKRFIKSLFALALAGFALTSSGADPGFAARAPFDPAAFSGGAVSAIDPTTDAAPGAAVFGGANAYPQATVNTTGGNVSLCPGIGRRLFTIVDYSLVDAIDTVTVTVNGSATVKTAGGTDWTAATSNAATATSLATAINTITGVVATASGSSVYIAPAATTCTLTLATSMDAGEGTATSGTDGTATVTALGLSSLAAQATNTVVGNATAGSAAPTALAVGSCSTSASALVWTTNTGFGCNTAIAASTVTNFTGTTSLTNDTGAGTLTWPAAGATLTIPTGGGTVLVSGGALGTPSSGVLSNLTGTLNAAVTASSLTSLGTITALVAGTGAFTGKISTTQGGTIIDGVAIVPSTNTDRGLFRITNLSSDTIFGAHGSSATGIISAGASAYDAVIRSTTGISFSADGGSNTQLRLASTGAVVTGTLAATGTITSPTFDRASAATLTLGGTATSLTIPNATVTSAATGVRFLCISTTGVVTSQAAACVGT